MSPVEQDLNEIVVNDEGIESSTIENGDHSVSEQEVSTIGAIDKLSDVKPNQDNETTDALSVLDIKMMDQAHLEKEVANDADVAILRQELEMEQKRLSKANDRYLKYKGKLLTLEKKLQGPNLKISEKTRLEVQIEELQDNEIVTSLRDVNEIKTRMRDIELMLHSKYDDVNDATEKLPDETKEEFLIRTGKITAFGTSNAFIEEASDVQAPTHKNLVMPGFNSVQVIDSESAKVIDIANMYGKNPSNDEENDPDFKIDYDEINSDGVVDDSEELDEILNREGEGKVKMGKNNRKGFKRKSLDEEEDRNIDDGDEFAYKRRLNEWISQRSYLRRKHMPEYVEDPSVPEWEKPHPTIRDAILNDSFKLPGDIHPSLFDYQKTCVQWLAELYNQKTGGIIGDEMGLGKTVQIISFLAGLHYSGNMKHPILVVCPATVLKQWCNEFHRWWPPFRAIILHSIGEGMNRHKRSKHNRSDLEELELNIENEEYGSVQTLAKTKDNKTVQELVDKVVKEGHVIITTYAGVRIYAKYLLPVRWGYAILDEGHKIRNPDSFITITCKQLKTPNRIILSGTPIQNNLVELWSLFDFVFPGRLGTLPVFQKQFCVPINLGGYANATNVQVQAGFKCATVLKDLVSPYLLRRVKADVAKDLPKKTEMVLFCKLTEEQRKLYQRFLDSGDFKKILSGKRNALYGIDMLRKICNHPQLVDLNTKDKKIIKLPKVKELASKSGKIQVVLALLELWTKEERKTLIFTQTKQMLNILNQLLDSYNKENGQRYNYMRMDGSTPIIQRQELVDQFNKNPVYNVFLLTTKVGGLGVNLTGASRVIIYDPDWNPSTDMQARERAWRLGQKQDVAIYRLIMAGSIEEKIYHRQIFKQFLTNKILKDPKQKRFFKMTDMYDLFTLGDDQVKGTETADLFGAEEKTFDGIKERKTKFRSRNLNRSGAQNLDEGDIDFIEATKAAGVASLEEYDEEQVKEKTMFEDDDSRVLGESHRQPNANIMSEIFQKSGIHSAVEHESILGQGDIRTSASQLLVDNEATRIANDAVSALKASRKQARTKKIGVPTWTGKYGVAGKLASGGNRTRAFSSALPNGVSGRGGSTAQSSATILWNLKRMDKSKSRKQEPTSQVLIDKLVEYMANVEGNFSKSRDILENLDIDVGDKKTVDVIRSMIKGVCTWDRDRKGWILKTEFK